MKMPKYVEDMNKRYGKTKTAPTSAAFREAHERTFGKKPTILRHRAKRPTSMVYRCKCNQREVSFAGTSYEPIPGGYVRHTREECG